MNNFAYARATDIADAVRQAAADASAKFIAGGTNLIDLMKEGVAQPSQLIDITHLPLKAVEETADGGLRTLAIGAERLAISQRRVGVLGIGAVALAFRLEGPLRIGIGGDRLVTLGGRDRARDIGHGLTAAETGGQDHCQGRRRKEPGGTVLLTHEKFLRERNDPNASAINR